jgi:hypothetical protein
MPSKPLDKDTVFVCGSLKHSEDKKAIYRTLNHEMRQIAKTNKTLKEVKENRKPRIAFCGFVKGANDNNPINLAVTAHGAHFSGLTNCGSYWRCPVCAQKISEQKKNLLSDMITAHQEKGYSVGFMTLTVRHSKFDVLKKTLDKLQNNYRTFQALRSVKADRKNADYLGQVKTLEITYSDSNGWHPHLHLLYFYKTNDADKIRLQMKKMISQWVKYKDNNGLVKAQNWQIIEPNPNGIAEYLAKYDISAEMTKGNIKGSKGLTPFTALAKIALQDYEDIQEKRRLYGIYSNYVEETQGRHYVNIGRSLYEEYPEFRNEIEKTDEEIVNEQVENEVVLKISVKMWGKICCMSLQAILINKYLEHGLEGIYNVLKYYKSTNDFEIEFDKNEIPIII